MTWLDTLLNKTERLVIGLMSGTSMDGIDAALVKIKGFGVDLKVDLVGFVCEPYEDFILSEFSKLGTNFSVERLSKLNFLVGEAFSDVALKVIERSGLKPENVDLIGSHGQTIYHNPPSRGSSIASTMQIGELDVIAERTGITTVGDFRTRDVAAYGEGAPLVPYTDFLLFRRIGEILIAQNIGGISNCTVVSDDLENTFAFDNGPGNVLIDSVVSIATDGKTKFDKDGLLASKGIANEDLLNDLLLNPYFSKKPPKSTGKELFGSKMANELYNYVKKREMKLEDLLSTLVQLTVESIVLSYRDFILPEWGAKEVILSGGGASNPLIVSRLRERLPDMDVSISEDYGVPPDSKEALSFAVLANETINGLSTNITNVTGALSSSPIGKIVIGKNIL